MDKRLKLLIIGSGLLFFFIFFSYLVHKNLFTHFDFNTTVRIQDKISRRFDEPFSWLSAIGRFEIMGIVLLIILLIKRKIIAGFVTVLLFSLFHVVEIYGKNVVTNTPPPEFLLRTKHLLNFPQYYIREVYSYPSGHSGRAAFLSVLLIFFIWESKFPKWLKLALIGGVLLYDVAMFVSRIYLGEHWTSDVVGGIMLGAALALLATPLFEKKKDRRKSVAT